MKGYINKSNGAPNKSMLKFLWNIKDWPTYVDLFSKIQNKSLQISKENGLNESEGNNEQPILTWQISGLDSNSYKESDPFIIDGCVWILAAW